jgi:predicted lactoylglutathione lyase
MWSSVWGVEKDFSVKHCVYFFVVLGFHFALVYGAMEQEACCVVSRQIDVMERDKVHFST